MLVASLALLPVLLVMSASAEQPGDVLRGTLVLCQCVGFGILAMDAAGRFSMEMEQGTLDSLLVLPDRASVFGIKWLGGLLSARLAFLMSVPMSLLMLAFGWICWISFFLLLAAWLIYTLFLTNLAVWLSLLTGSTLRARMVTLIIALGIMGGFYLLADNVRAMAPRGPVGKLAAAVGDFGTIPPATLWTLAFHQKSLTPPVEPHLRTVPVGKDSSDELAYRTEVAYRLWQVENARRKMMGAMFGLLVYALLALLFWILARRQFRGLIASNA